MIKTLINHPYIITSIKDVDNIFIYKSDYFDDFSKLLMEYPTFAINSTDSWIKKNRSNVSEFDYSKFEHLIDLKIFESEIEQIIDKKRLSFIMALELIILNLSVETQIQILITRLHNALKENINFLSKNDKDSYLTRKKVIESLLKSYKMTMSYFETTYSINLHLDNNSIKEKEPKENKYSIEKTNYIYNDDISKLKEVEQRLIDNGFLNKDSFIWEENKTLLVDFVRVLRIQKNPIIRQNISQTKVFKFFEKRYKTDVGTLRRKSKYKIRPIEGIIAFNFLFN